MNTFETVIAGHIELMLSYIDHGANEERLYNYYVANIDNLNRFDAIRFTHVFFRDLYYCNYFLGDEKRYVINCFYENGIYNEGTLNVSDHHFERFYDRYIETASFDDVYEEGLDFYHAYDNKPELNGIAIERLPVHQLPIPDIRGEELEYDFDIERIYFDYLLCNEDI